MPNAQQLPLLTWGVKWVLKAFFVVCRRMLMIKASVIESLRCFKNEQIAIPYYFLVQISSFVLLHILLLPWS